MVGAVVGNCTVEAIRASSDSPAPTLNTAAISGMAAMTTAPNGHLLVANGLNGQVVEVDPESGKQLYARWVDANKAQTPPGNGNLFGLAMTLEKDGFYFVNDDVNQISLSK